ncbi:MAG: YgfZ/GcvT domain-containing protein, partial [Verrucomicrobiales bacterium]
GAGIVSRSSERFCQPGFDLLLPAATPLPDGLDLLSTEAAEALRIRNGVPMWGRELTPDTLPAEAGLDASAIDFHKGCYIGQEVISRIKSVGRVNRKLARLRAVGEIPPGEELCPGMRLIDGETQVGTLTSVAGSEALGFVKRDHDQPGTRLSLAPAAAGDADNDQKKILSTSLEIVESRQA